MKLKPHDPYGIWLGTQIAYRYSGHKPSSSKPEQFNTMPDGNGAQVSLSPFYSHSVWPFTLSVGALDKGNGKLYSIAVPLTREELVFLRDVITKRLQEEKG